MNNFNFKFGDFCRLCLRQSEDLIYLKSNDLDLISYMDKLEFLNEALAPQNDIFPNWLCHKCKKHLCYAYKFTKRCLTSLIVLNETLSQIKQNHFGDSSKQFYITHIKNVHKNSSDEDPLINYEDPDSPESEDANFLQIQIKEEPDDIDIGEEKFHPFDSPSNVFHMSQPDSVFPQDPSNEIVVESVLDNTILTDTLDNTILTTTLDNTTLDTPIMDKMVSGTQENSRLYTILQMPSASKPLADKTILTNTILSQKHPKKSHLRTILAKPPIKSTLHNVQLVKTVNKLDKTTMDKSVLDESSNKSRKKIKLEDTTETIPDPNMLQKPEEILLVPQMVSVKNPPKRLKTPKEEPDEDNSLFINSTFTCNLCHQVFENDTDLTTHYMAHKSLFSCAVCAKSFKAKDLLTRHLESHLTEEDRHYYCNICGQKFTNIRKMRKHFSDEHKAKKRGPKEPKTKKMIQSSSKINEELFECNICSEKFIEKRVLVIHMRKHFD